ncbi:MAG: bifunctional hydroxymethylpyrimidine kinase/phosphomethylpyrimidine kinase [Leptolyngbya sp.]|nr:bifunctional hydroxymethylpyrimidine kinase/phosphomethylpyrimidine kinase [Candidatus Melainabacteria bacterium]
MSFDKLSAIVIGSINTDIVGLGFPGLLKPGEIGYGTKMKVGPGGKSRNIAQMLATLLGSARVAMIGRTTQDPFGLWRPPVDALIEAGVDCSGIRFVRFDKESGWPGIALIPVASDGTQQIYVIEGVNAQFSEEDLEKSDHLFKAAARNRGLLALTMEIPIDTAIFGIKKAKAHGLKVMMDPGGTRQGLDISALITSDIFLLKPNEQEASLLTGLEIVDRESAVKAARQLVSMGPEHVLLTCGAHGALLASKDGEVHIECPKLELADTKDATGCGDQTMATICATLQRGKDIQTAAGLAVLSGTLQFYREGIVPVSEHELAAAAK